MTEPTLKLVPASYDIISFKAADMPHAYEAMIFAKWLRALRYGNPYFKNIESEPYYTHYHKFIENLLDKPGSIVRIAALSDDHDVALGFSVNREDVLDFIYVHKDHRKMGVGRKLYPEGITTMSHITLTAIEIWRRNDHYKHLKFNPHA